jgi:cytochrome c5
MTKKMLFSAALIAMSIVPVWAVQEKKTDDKRPNAMANNQPKETTGDDVFQANCQRCHMPPMSISPRTTGTIIMHMRTRARLSREDEIKLLRFMAP